ncbi:MAG: hypothetical protein H0W86_13970 [Armatimonadetes bacterium]|nr:hypothetical protein [Armatimonadota bacterium]
MLIEKTRRLADDFRNFEHYRLRILLAADGSRPSKRRPREAINLLDLEDPRGSGLARGCAIYLLQPFSVSVAETTRAARASGVARVEAKTPEFVGTPRDDEQGHRWESMESESSQELASVYQEEGFELQLSASGLYKPCSNSCIF